MSSHVSSVYCEFVHRVELFSRNLMLNAAANLRMDMRHRTKMCVAACDCDDTRLRAVCSDLSNFAVGKHSHVINVNTGN
jgi:hypothetical protein